MPQEKGTKGGFKKSKPATDPMDDHLQAVLRSKIFQKDVAAFKVHVDRRLGKLDPQKRSKYFALILTKNSVAQKWNIPTFLTLVGGEILGPPGSWKGWGWHPRQAFVQDVVPGKSVTIRLPLNLPKELIVRHVRKLYDYYGHPLTPQRKIRHKAKAVDPWLVWDRHHLVGHSLQQISKELYGFKENPAYSKQAKQAYERVYHACQYAEQRIEMVNDYAAS